MNDFAPQYTQKERVKIVLKLLAWIIPVYLVMDFWFFDWLEQYSQNAHCYEYGSFNGLHLLIYGSFVLIPFSLGIFVLLIEGRNCLKVMRLKQTPLPGEKVLRPVKYKYGTAALIRPAAVGLIILLSFVISIWGGFQAHKLSADIVPCEKNQLLNQSD